MKVMLVERQTFRNLGKVDNEILLSLYRMGNVYPPAYC